MSWLYSQDAFIEREEVTRCPRARTVSSSLVEGAGEPTLRSVVHRLSCELRYVRSTSRGGCRRRAFPYCWVVFVLCQSRGSTSYRIHLMWWFKGWKRISVEAFLRNISKTLFSYRIWDMYSCHAAPYMCTSRTINLNLRQRRSYLRRRTTVIAW